MIKRFKAWKLLRQGQSHLRLGDPLRAAALIASGLELRPEDTGLRMHMALAMSAAGMHEEASSNAQRAIGLAPRNPAFHCLSGMIRLDADRPEEALTLFDRALELAPAYLAARAYRGLALLVMGKVEQGSREIRSARGFGITSFEARLLYACESMMLKTPEARPIEDTVKDNEQYKPDCTAPGVRELIEGKAAGEAHTDLELDTAMDCLLTRKDFASALNLLALYAEAALNAPHRQAVAGFVLLRSGRPGEALAHLGAARKADSTDYRIHYYMGLAHAMLGDRASAVACFGHAADQVNPGIAMNRLGEYARVASP